MDEIADSEVILRHVRGGSMWQAEGPVLTTANFRLRADRGETGISVTRATITSPERLLQLVQTTPGSRVAAARVGDVRALGLRVVPDPQELDPGHALIQNGTAGLNQRAVQKRLANVFQFLDLSPSGDGASTG